MLCSWGTTLSFQQIIYIYSFSISLFRSRECRYCFSFLDTDPQRRLVFLFFPVLLFFLFPLSVCISLAISFDAFFFFFTCLAKQLPHWIRLWKKPRNSRRNYDEKDIVKTFVSRVWRRRGETVGVSLVQKFIKAAGNSTEEVVPLSNLTRRDNIQRGSCCW